jgi:hypothetical protein
MRRPVHLLKEENPAPALHGRISALSSLPSGPTDTWSKHQNPELPMTNFQWQIFDFRPRATPHGFSGLKIGH